MLPQLATMPRSRVLELQLNQPDSRAIGLVHTTRSQTSTTYATNPSHRALLDHATFTLLCAHSMHHSTPPLVCPATDSWANMPHPVLFVAHTAQRTTTHVFFFARSTYFPWYTSQLSFYMFICCYEQNNAFFFRRRVVLSGVFCSEHGRHLASQRAD